MIPEFLEQSCPEKQITGYRRFPDLCLFADVLLVKADDVTVTEQKGRQVGA